VVVTGKHELKKFPSMAVASVADTLEWVLDSVVAVVTWEWVADA